MREITELMDHYREVVRSVWNTGFWTVEELRNWDSSDRFEQIKKQLFYALVVARLDADDQCCRDLTTANYSFRIVPRDPGPVPIMIQHPREGDRSSYWDDPVTKVSAPGVELEFLDYFDWNKMAYADFQYYRVRIVAFASQPHLVGREALMEHLNADVFVAPLSREQGSAAG